MYVKTSELKLRLVRVKLEFADIRNNRDFVIQTYSVVRVLSRWTNLRPFCYDLYGPGIKASKQGKRSDMNL